MNAHVAKDLTSAGTTKTTFKTPGASKKAIDGGGSGTTKAEPSQQKKLVFLLKKESNKGQAKVTPPTISQNSQTTSASKANGHRRV